MSEWRELVMKDVMAEFYDGPHATPPPSDSGGVYLGIKNITDGGRLDLSDVRRIAENDMPRWTKRVAPQADDVVFTYEATLHRYALIPDGFHGCLGRRLALIRPNTEVVLPRYLHLALLGPEWRQTATDRTISGSTVDRLPITDFPDFPIRLPDLAAQRAIVEVLGAIDDLIEVNRRRLAVLEEVARSLYREWFVRGHESAQETTRLDELVHVDKGLSYKGSFLTDEGLPMANLKCVKPGGGFRRNGTKPYSGPFKPKHAVRPRDLVMANTDLTQAGGVIGSPAWVPRRSFGEGGLLSHHLFAIRADDRDLLAWLYWHFESPEFRGYARSVASGTTVLGFRPADLLGHEVCVPNRVVLSRFGDLASNVAAEVEAVEDAIESLAEARDLLLPRLVSGRIDVSGLDLDRLVEEALVG